MPAKRKAMKSIRELLRLRYEAKLSYRKISLCLNMSLGAIKRYFERADKAGINWPIDEALSDGHLEKLLFPPAVKDKYPGLDFHKIHHELKRHKGVTRQLLYEEYREIAGCNIPSYSQFCRDFRLWLKKQKPSYRHHHKGGEQCQVDYCGPTLPVCCPRTGVVKQAQVFVGVLSASNYTYAEATWTQSLPDWIQSHTNMYQFFGGVPELTLVDNLKSGVTTACRYEPLNNPTYQQLSEHYRTTIFPVRPYKPKDKGKAENAVLVVERWIMARLRNHQFFSLKEANQAIRMLLDDLNNRPFKAMPGSRKSHFEELDKPALRALPLRSFEYFESGVVRVGQDYHFQFEQHHYSVPYGLAKCEVELKYTDKTLRVYYQNKLVATHLRSQETNQASTIKEHQPISHQKITCLSNDEWLEWGIATGPSIAECVLDICISHHPMRTHRICTGIQSLLRTHGSERLEKACKKSLALGHVSYKSLKLMLRNKMESVPTLSEPERDIVHSNIRGSGYYQP